MTESLIDSTETVGDDKGQNRIDDWMTILKVIGAAAERLSQEDLARAIAAACVFHDIGEAVGDKLIVAEFKDRIDRAVGRRLVPRARVRRR